MKTLRELKNNRGNTQSVSEASVSISEASVFISEATVAPSVTASRATNALTVA